VEHTSRSSGLPRVEANLVGFPCLASRLTEARRRVVRMAPLRMLCRSQVEDGRVDVTDYIRPFYPTFTVFNVLGNRDIVVIYSFA
jgi:hypothetical protein